MGEESVSTGFGVHGGGVFSQSVRATGGVFQGVVCVHGLGWRCWGPAWGMEGASLMACGSKCVVRMHMLNAVALCCAVLCCTSCRRDAHNRRWSANKLLSLNSGALRHKPHHAYTSGQRMTQQ
jgi:hypothetical protein